ncbi:UNKNOWN [Stylonychia lemnae]|uniref:Uncharacterized protein n=1 Tax=Stylonychia lemnae TaxID=5949 RepID=A0A078AEI1_STYLE|nr:UNKNOWN [Stylonychia lemnae]|eukprot:CDW80625.1 UNKNOWN [Stylonychia lemnae]
MILTQQKFDIDQQDNSLTSIGETFRQYQKTHYEYQQRNETNDCQHQTQQARFCLQLCYQPANEKEFKELQVDLVKRQLIEERYQPKRYCNQEIKPPTPTIDPSKVFITQGQKINQNNYNSKSTVTLLTSRKQRQQSPHNSQSNDLKTDQQPLHLIALRKNRDNLINILTSEEQKELRLKITPEQINKLQKETFNQVKQAYLDDQQQKRQIQYKKVIMSRKSCDQVAFDMRFLPKKQRAKLQQRLRWYVVNNVNMNIEIDKGNKVEYKFDQEIDQYFKDNFGYK